MNIIKIKKLSNDKYQISLPNKQKITTYDSVILKYNLLYKKELDKELLSLIIKETNYYDIYKKVVTYISKRLRSSFEIKKYLEKYELNNQQLETILKELKDNNLLNDYKFAKAFISDKIYLSNYGPLKIKKELMTHFIDNQIIDDLLNEIDEKIIVDKLNKMIIKKVNSNKNCSNYLLRQKLLYYFKDLGYESEMILELLNQIKCEDSNVLELEYNKLYRKYSKKYSDVLLDKKIKDALYRKGFNINKINELIDEKKES